MDRLQKTEITTRPAGQGGAETGRILKFPPRPARLAMADCGSGWYHQAAIDEPSRPSTPKR